MRKKRSRIKPAKKAAKRRNYPQLISELALLIEQGRKAAAQYVNTAMVASYWLMGRSIVEYEQQGKERAEYGEKLLEKLSLDLKKKFGRGFSPDNLEAMRAFYLTYGLEISETVSRKSGLRKSGALSRRPGTGHSLAEYADRFRLSWSHYRLLLRMEDGFKREFYESESIRGNWSVRQLDRQMQSMLYERTALSKRKLAVLAKAGSRALKVRPEDEIKDPYVLEFLGLKDEYSESQLEEVLIGRLENFLLEMGVGFTFVARQKRIAVEGGHYRLDLLLYHRILNCLVAIDLKIGEFSHSDAGQMNLYLNYLKAREKLPGENDPVGIILCSDKRKTVVEYALGGLSNKIFASAYKIRLPDPEIIRAEIEKERGKLFK